MARRKKWIGSAVFNCYDCYVVLQIDTIIIKYVGRCNVILKGMNHPCGEAVNTLPQHPEVCRVPVVKQTDCISQSSLHH